MRPTSSQCRGLSYPFDQPLPLPVPRLELCHYSGYKIYPSKGRKYIRVDGKVGAIVQNTVVNGKGVQRRRHVLYSLTLRMGGGRGGGHRLERLMSFVASNTSIREHSQQSLSVLRF